MDNYQLAPSAADFLKRIDALEEVTPHHYIWYQKHPNDEHASLDELADEIKASERLSPVRIDSKNGSIRELAQKYETYRLKAQKENNIWPSGFNWGVFGVYVLGRIRLLQQVFRVPIALLTLILTSHLITNFREYQLPIPGLPPHALSISIIAFLTLHLIYQLFILIWDDEIFSRAWLNWSSASREGLFVHPNDQFSQDIVSKMPLLTEKETYPFGWINGDIQTLIPGLLWDNIDLKISYLRRFVRNPFDSECFALDIAFPRDANGQFYHDSSKQIIVFHHGLNGSSFASYIQAHVSYYNKLGHTCIPINARGFGGTFILTKPF